MNMCYGVIDFFVRFLLHQVQRFTFQAPASMNINTALRQVALVEGRNLIDLV